jgi:hypothetical protein
MKSYSILVSLIIALLAGTDAEAKYSGGTGDPNDPYRIARAEDLNDIGNHQEDWNKYFILVNDVNLFQYTGTQLKMIGVKFGDVGIPFTGVFDGDNHTISNFTYTGNEKYAIGLFGYIGVGGKISNVWLEDANVINNYWDSSVGALAGVNRGTIWNCYAKGKVLGVFSPGGIVGYNYYGLISNSYASGTVSGKYFTGGLVGVNLGTIVNCYAASEVCGYDYTGGLLGENYHGTVACCYATGEIRGTYHDTGGLVGVNVDGTLLNCYSACDVSGEEGVGGLVGYNDYDCIITNCYSAGSVDGNDLVGGLMGINYYGGIISSYFLVTSGLDNGYGKPLTDEQMKQQASFMGWDFIEIWGIGENQTYPFLLTDPAGDLDHDKKIDFADLAILASHWLEER